MASKINYRQERAHKTRAREAKQEEKVRRREEASAKRRALREKSLVDEQKNKTEQEDNHR